MGVGCGSCSSNDETAGDCICVDCVKGGMQCLPNNPDGRTISKTRGVPSMGSTNYGPRGQRQSFRSYSGDQTMEDERHSTNPPRKAPYNLFTQQYFIGIGVGALVGYYLLPKLLKK
tara:strand:- start:314 stop:661 length:348 start_codon:yes stop_codon:yes gene_type:complete